MKIDTKNILAFALLALISFNCAKKESIYAKKVNPFIGTGGHGHTYPGATAPFGMVQLSPDTRVKGWDACSGYHYSDSTLLGFSHTHLSGTGAADYGDILFTPHTSSQDQTPIGFSHQNEQAWAGYYSVKLANNVKVALTTTTRVGIHLYEYAASDSAYLSIDLQHGIGPDYLLGSAYKIISPTEITGYRRSSGWAKDQVVYFAARFSEPFTVLANQSDSTKAWLRFNKLKAPLMVKVGLSAVSVDNALVNIDKEAPGWEFDDYQHKAEKTWDKELRKIKATFPDDATDTVFYTALYHASLAPNTFSDVNGEYRGMDQQTYTTTSKYYTVFSLWDTFRATHPLFTLLNQKRDVEMINTMLAMYKQSGLLPVWELAANETNTMIGYHAIPVITDAMVKKLSGFDYDLALEAMLASANHDQQGLKYYHEMGYIPAEKEHESVSKTLEYAYDDWCIATAADLLDNADIAKHFYQRAQYYKNLYDPSTGFMRARRNGNWIADFDPFEVSGNYTEANAWQYNLFIPQDISYLDTFYSNTTLKAKLDSLFTAKTLITGRDQPDIAGMIGQYAHGNEPSHNFAYLYNYTDTPWKTQEIVHQINTTLYHNQPDGLSGNEDCGQMSAWYVFSALGFYPVIPGKAEYALGTPLVKQAKLTFESGVTFTVEAQNLSPDNYYVQAVFLNNRPLNRSFITHEEIIKGGRLVFQMGNQPANAWHNEPIEKPQALIAGDKITITPIINGGEMTFTDSITIQLSSPEKKVSIFYTTDGSIPDSSSTPYTEAFHIDTTMVIKARAFKRGQIPSQAARADYIKIPFGRSISLKYPYSHNYTGNSQMALIDYIRGGENFRDGWQGYHGVDLEATVDLGKPMEVTAVSVGFLQDNYSWIFYPSELSIMLSIDGKRFVHKKNIKNLVEPMADGLITQDLGATFNNQKARYIKIIAKSLGTCPAWHKGAGNKAWLFADEIIITTK